MPAVAIRPKPLACAIRAAAFALALPLLSPVLAWAEPAAQRYQIEAGDLETALTRFARQAGVLLSFDPSLTAGRQSAGLQGDYSATEGFAVLLGGSGLQAVMAADGSYRLQRLTTTGTLQLPSASVIGELDSPVGEDRGYVARNSRSASKTNTALHETPRSVSVVTQQQMDDRNVVSISDALRYSAGIQAGYFGEDNKQDWFILRGFKQANNGLFQDGVRVYSSGFYSWQVDPYSLERVEVLKGASSVLYGQATPGGVINLQSKRPTLEQKNEVGVQYGSFQRKQVHLDVGGKLDEQGDVLYRVVGLSRDSGTQVDDVGSERLLLAPSLTLNFNADTSLTLLASVQKDNADPQLQFLPAEGSLIGSVNGQIDDETALGNPAYEKFDRTQATLGYELNYRLSDAWDFQQNFRYGELNVDLRQMYYAGHAIDVLNSAAAATAKQFSIPLAMAFGLVSAQYPDLNDPSRQKVMRGLTYTDGRADNLSLDNRLVNYWQGAGVENTFLLGVDYQQLNINEKGFAADPLIREPLNIYQPSYAASTTLLNPATLAVLGPQDLQDKRTRADQLGFYLQEQLKLDERWVLLLGGRFDNARSDLDNRSTGVHKSIRDEEFTWTAGAAYLADNGLTPYVSYSEFFLPVADINISTGEPYQPESGEQLELGLKYQPAGFAGAFNLALFELTQQNVRKNTVAGTRTQLGEVRSRGLEFEASADLSDNLSLVGSLTLLDAQTRKTTVLQEQGKTPSQVAERMASLWATYAFQGPLTGLKVGAGARYTGESYGDNRETDALRVPSYSLYDAMLSYQLNDVTLQLNANNLGDKEYVATCDYYCWYGNRRNLIASVSYAW
ncbi:Iron complex outermembrane recepter protein [Pseudomonas sp. 8BK]|uniref:TonB-dependent siderophore receptor n=1 Tax=Pseudomonas sp. 8BK TaxID=2653164 RepID=UPI0012F07FED|nr:TonB-dependent siderophore receptor [Pseudomonas sp. 8BK]VXB14963.1 Iron complex outermembrane recepter protein [Pseudomonas sp. 8BK]